MTQPRAALVDPAYTPYYHCVSRCVRRAYLCGKDALTGFDFEHRRAWIERRLQELAGIFAIDLCAYAIMDNHYHVVLHINRGNQGGMSDAEVLRRWGMLHKVPADLDKWDPAARSSYLAVRRERLGSISWFMKSVNEPLARFANREDGCKGRFWEGRFRSQALLDEAAVIKCMAYVDLNPVRAGKARTPESSRFTSARARIERRDSSLAPMIPASFAGFVLPIQLTDYLAFLDSTGRVLRHGKRGRIAGNLPSIVDRLAFASRTEWLAEMSNLSRRYCRAIGNVTSLRAYRDYLGQKRLHGVVG